MKIVFRSLLAAILLAAASTTSYAWWSDDDDYWGGPWNGGDWNPYDEWDPRYWVREMDNEMADDDWDKYGPMMYNRGYGGYPGYGGGYPGYGGGYPPPYGGGYYGAPYGGGYAAPAPAPAPGGGY